MAKRILDRQKIYDKLMHGKTYKTYSRAYMWFLGIVDVLLVVLGVAVLFGGFVKACFFGFGLAIFCSIYIHILWNDEQTVNRTLEKWKRRHMGKALGTSWTKYKIMVSKVADKLGSEVENEKEND